MTVRQFAEWHGIGYTTARECVNATSENYPPIRAKRLPNGRVYVTAEAAAEWRENLPDA